MFRDGFMNESEPWTSFLNERVYWTGVTWAKIPKELAEFQKIMRPILFKGVVDDKSRKCGPKSWKALSASLVVFRLYPVNMREQVKVFNEITWSNVIFRDLILYIAARCIWGRESWKYGHPLDSYYSISVMSLQTPRYEQERIRDIWLEHWTGNKSVVSNEIRLRITNAKWNIA